jgi:hypothetical protein
MTSCRSWPGSAASVLKVTLILTTESTHMASEFHRVLTGWMMRRYISEKSN